MAVPNHLMMLLVLIVVGEALLLVNSCREGAE